jgi:hypothetical protein
MSRTFKISGGWALWDMYYFMSSQTPGTKESGIELFFTRHRAQFYQMKKFWRCFTTM